MKLDHDFEGGTPFDVERPESGIMSIVPRAPGSGSQWFYLCFRCRCDGQGPHADDVMCIRWPRSYGVEDLPPELDEEVRFRMTSHDNFAAALHRTLFWSPDMRTWKKLKVEPADSDRSIMVPVPDQKRAVYIATQIPYLATYYESLIEHVRSVEPDALLTLGKSQGGRPIYGFRFADRDQESTDDDSAIGPVLHLQAYQHLTEFTGPRVLDAIARALAGRPDHPLRAKMTVDMVPVVDVDGLDEGVGMLLEPPEDGQPRAGEPNPNRCWSNGAWPEVEAVRAHVRRTINQGGDYRLALDLHNGWYKVDVSGACYTMEPASRADEAYRGRQKRFIDWMYRHTDHDKPGTYWEHDTGGRTFASWLPTLCPDVTACTVEFSRHIWWNRKRESYEPVDVHHPEQFALQALEAITEYPLSEEPKED
ncbi:MAG: hypothetical protein JJU36_05355 [Phycisphaeraceae bacterium]|nr:hypothetical protein [Phycisphaeraceae bacterium]